MANVSVIYPYRSIPILAYHQIAETTPAEDHLRLAVPPKIFESQMKYLYDHGYTTITLDELAEIENKKQDIKKRIAITFDDGYLDNFTVAFPVMQQFGFKATIFAVSDFFGKYFGRDNNKPVLYMDRTHAKEMLQHGFSFQSHTCTHPHLPMLTSERALWELTASREKIEDTFGKPVRHFAYPYGEYNNEVIEMVKESGYLSAYAAGMSEMDRYSKERFCVELKDSPFIFSLMVSGSGSWIRRIRNRLCRGCGNMQ